MSDQVLPTDSPDYITVKHAYALYGHLWNTTNGTETGAPAAWCAPTATANSLIYLQNRYPLIYDDLLVSGASPAAAVGMRDALANGWTGPNGARAGMLTKDPGGDPAKDITDDRSIWETKNYYLDDYAEGMTSFKGMVAV